MLTASTNFAHSISDNGTYARPAQFTGHWPQKLHGSLRSLSWPHHAAARSIRQLKWQWQIQSGRAPLVLGGRWNGGGVVGGGGWGWGGQERAGVMVIKPYILMTRRMIQSTSSWVAFESWDERCKWTDQNNDAYVTDFTMISEYKALPLNDSHPTSYLTNHTQSVGMHCHNSEPVPISFGVPQGSVLGPAVLFALYTTSLPTVTEKRSVLHHSYVNDSQLQKYAPPHQIPDLLLSMQKCINWWR